MSRHLSSRNISSKSMHAFLVNSNLANRQTDRQTGKQTNERAQTHLPPRLSEVNKQLTHKALVIAYRFDVEEQHFVVERWYIRHERVSSIVHAEISDSYRP